MVVCAAILFKFIDVINNNPEAGGLMNSALIRAAKVLFVTAVAAGVAAGCATAKTPPAQATPPASGAAAGSGAGAGSAGAMGGGDTYTVVKGDCLWCISGKSQIYGDPYKWPLIFRANKGQIKDADLIYPKQVLTIDRGASDALQAAAIKHARTRGAWALGTVEASDTKFLSAHP